jgi:hypothetical protein
MILGGKSKGKVNYFKMKIILGIIMVFMPVLIFEAQEDAVNIGKSISDNFYSIISRSVLKRVEIKAEIKNSERVMVSIVCYAWAGNIRRISITSNTSWGDNTGSNLIKKFWGENTGDTLKIKSIGFQNHSYIIKTESFNLMDHNKNRMASLVMLAGGTKFKYTFNLIGNRDILSFRRVLVVIDITTPFPVIKTTGTILNDHLVEYSFNAGDLNREIKQIEVEY